MTLATTKAIALSGLNGEVVTVEVDIADGLPGYTLLGLPDAALTESRDRVRAAIVNTGLHWPNKKVTIALLPAWLPKSGSGFDLSIAMGILGAQGIIQGVEELLFVGELSLDGKLRQTRGVLPSLICAFRNGIRKAVIPTANAAEAKLLPEMDIFTFEKLSEIVHWLQSGEIIEQSTFDLEIEKNERYLDFADVAGQSAARRAAEISAAGGHNFLMIGPPGVGKTMIAERLPTILPPLSKEETLEVSAIHSITNSDRTPLSTIAPFISPHHSTTRIAMVGGGAHVIKPGVCSLAHRGVLFIDEAPECGSGVLDSLRQPLESGSITISRANGNLTFPAQFILVLAANPCPCGKFAGKGLGCTCTSLQVRRYLNKLSGPLLDRIDLRVPVENVSRVELAEMNNEPSETMRNRVIAARAVAAERFKDESWKLNSEIPARALRQKYQPDRSAMNFLHDELDKERITARGLHKIIRTSWTIADLKGRARPALEEVKESYRLREGIE
ncbi:MAG: YifB family Mg chelatase-like AAA ATPase [Candidatus Nanopelagicaceae bacterium]|jgi:magnesium chelatase family protein